MQLPTARRADLIVEQIPDEVLVYDLRTHKAHSLNPTAALVWQHCDGKTTLAEAAKAISLKLNVPESIELVSLALTRLESAKLLDDGARVPTGGAEVSRRAVMKKLALTGGLVVLLPTITSVLAPTPAQAQTCVNPGGAPPGGPCNVHADCCSNHCIPGQNTCR